MQSSQWSHFSPLEEFYKLLLIIITKCNFPLKCLNIKTLQECLTTEVQDMPKTTYLVLYWMNVIDSNLLQVFGDELKCSIINRSVLHGEFTNQMLYFVFRGNIPEILCWIFSTMCSVESTQP
jgi:hypothetical protein